MGFVPLLSNIPTKLLFGSNYLSVLAEIKSCGLPIDFQLNIQDTLPFLSLLKYNRADFPIDFQLIIEDNDFNDPPVDVTCMIHIS